MAASTVVPHVFLTRFNLPANRVERSIFSDEWLTARMELFEKYTVPSVRAQLTVGEVVWIIYLGDSTPDWLRQRMSELADELPVLPIYLGGPLDPTELRGHVREAVGKADGPVVTSNLDNDDGLAKDYVRRVRELTPESRPGAVYLTMGLIRREGDVYLRRDEVNAFVAVVDDLGSDDFRTCWAGFHNQLEEQMPVVRDAGTPAWLQVVHGRNVSNRVGGRLTPASNHASLYAGLLEDVPAPSVGARARDLLSQPARTARDRVVRPTAVVLRRLIGLERYESLKMAVQRRH
ncbi:glycosyltransferase [Ornithinimicrobium sp. LYQ92]|uniref:glycosyltransferase n=1 Tax=Serinicoccus sp. LYQ92 TaxID=3378798 RepID=UPI00385220C1